MYRDAATQANLRTLAERGISVIEPEVGALASRGEHGVGRLPSPETLSREPEANAVFARLPHEAIAPLQERSPFYVWDSSTDEVRWVAAWDVTEADVDAFAADVREVLARR